LESTRERESEREEREREREKEGWRKIYQEIEGGRG
jgi:hypothetical protein